MSVQLQVAARGCLKAQYLGWLLRCADIPPPIKNASMVAPAHKRSGASWDALAQMMPVTGQGERTHASTHMPAHLWR